MPNIWTTLLQNNKPIMALAPLENVTDVVFREIVTYTHKPDVMFTEFTHTDECKLYRTMSSIRKLDYTENQRPIIAQIWGTDPAEFELAAGIVAKLGFDGVDLNMGCPVRDVLKLGACSGLIAEPPKAAEIISATKRGAGNLPVSVKTRIGLHKIQTEEWIGFLLEQGLAALTVHGRTTKEMSKVPAHWDEIAKAVYLRNKIAPQTVLLGNGDVMSYEEAVSKQEEFGVDGVMIGRGIFHNPWVFDKEVYEHSVQERLDLVLKHTELWFDTYGEDKPFEMMRKYFKIYINGFAGAKELRERLMECNSFAQVSEIVVKVKKHL